MLEEIIAVRSKEPIKDWKPIYMFALAWDRLTGVGVGEDYDALDRLKMILQKAAGLDLHIIFFRRLVKFSTFFFIFLHCVPKRFILRTYLLVYLVFLALFSPFHNNYHLLGG